MKEKAKNFILSGKFNYTLNHKSPLDFVKSQWQTREKCATYIIYRWIFAAFYLFSFFFSFITSICRGEIKIHFIYLTNWIMFHTAVYCLLAAVLVTLHYNNRLEISERIEKLFKLMWFLSIIVTMYSFLITLTYWTILFNPNDPKSKIDFNNVFIHITNCLIVLDVLVVKYKWNISQFVWPLSTGLTYLIFSFIYPMLGGVNRWERKWFS